MLTACPVPEKAKSRDLVAAFIRGAPKDAEGFVFYGVKASNAEQWRRVVGWAFDHYVIDNSYFDATRGLRFRVTKNRLQVNARELDSDCKRFDALGLEVKPWVHRPDGYWLALHQSDDHLHMAPDHKRWMDHACGSLFGRIVQRAWDRDKGKLASTLRDALAGAMGLVTHTSAGAVTAVLEGVPVVVSEQHALHGMVWSEDHLLDQRRRFLGVLADHEFTTTELEDGTAWRRLHP